MGRIALLGYTFARGVARTCCRTTKGLASYVLIAITLVVTVVSPLILSPEASASTAVGGNDYPWSGASDCSAQYGIYSWCENGSDLSPLRFGYRNCTDYAAYEINEQLGGTTSNIKFSWSNINYGGDGNAEAWKSGAAGKWTTDSNPAVGSVAWWGTESDGGFGHVAIVASVASDGNSIVVNEYNHDQKGDYDARTLTKTSGWPDAFIHIADIATDGPLSNSSSTAYVYYPLAGDFNGDGLGDIGLYNSNNGIFYIKHGLSFGDQTTYHWAAGNYQPFVGDFNGDGFTDIGLRNISTGEIFIKHGPSFGDQITYQWASGANYQVFAGDFNGDGLADIGLRNVSNGNFFIKHGPSFGDQIVYTWAAGTNYQPFIGDFNGDGKADIGLRNVSNGNFFIKHGPNFSDQLVYTWASGANYQPFIGDFNGDGLDDIGLRNVSNGNFFIKHGPSFGDQLVYTWAPD